MGIIRQLSTDVINKIAAGEVVERPSSVAKELIENSIDAGATEIIIELQAGGTELIRITDNGSGMSREDAEISIKPHTTSKLINIEDLQTLDSMGFRGEALASISSVSNFEIITKRLVDNIGTHILIEEEGGVIEEIAAPNGTQVTVAHLFYNVPARKKFLKKLETEYLHILDLFLGFAVLYHKISWTLIHNDHQVYQLSSTNNWIDRVKEVLGLNVSKDLLSLKVDGTISIDGFIGAPILARANKKQQFLYINGRLVYDFAISKAVSQAFGATLTDKSYPLFILNISIPKEKVDINVHPRKTEVRFSEQSEVYRLVSSSVRNLLQQNGLLNAAVISNDRADYVPADNHGFLFKPSSQSRDTSSYLKQVPLQSNSLGDSTFKSVAQALKFTESIAHHGSMKASHELLDDWKLVGQIHKSYLIVETQMGFLVIDQHAAAERLNYERLKLEMDQHKGMAQPLLMPLTLELSMSQLEVLKQAQNSLENLGFAFEFFGGQTIALQAVPQTLIRADIDETFKGIISDLENESQHLHSMEEAQEVALKYTACRGAIMFADRLTQEEQMQLLTDIKALPDEKHTCAHGRPFMKEFKKFDLEKLFDRR